MKDSEQDYAHRVARDITSKHFQQAAITAATLAKANAPGEPCEALFYSAAQLAAQATLSELHSELEKAQEAVASVSISLESSLQWLMQENPDSLAVDSILSARRDVSLYCSSCWLRFWEAHKAHFTDFIGIKPRTLEASYTPDYSGMVEDFLAMGEADEFHPFYLWYAGGVNTLADYTRLMGSKEPPMSSEALRIAFERLRGEANASARAVEFVRWARESWGEVQKEVQSLAKDQYLPTLEMSYQIGKKLRQHYGSHAE